MEVGDFSQKFREMVLRIFHGSESDYYSSLTEDHFIQFETWLKSQDIQTVEDINYIRLLQDTGIQLFPTIKGIVEKKELNPTNIFELQWHGRIFVSSLYKEVFYSDDLFLKTKIDIGYFLKTILTTAKDIYAVDMIYEQQTLIDLINKDAIGLTDKLTAFESLMDIINSDEKPEYYPPYWLDSKQQALELSEKLFKARFTSNSQAFYHAVYSVLDKPCNWKKTKTSLLYLIGLIYSRHQHFPNPAFAHIVRTFTINGKPTTIKVLTTQYGQMEFQFFRKPKDLKGEFKLLKNMVDSVFPES
jgi:hypothetical protein